MEPIIEYTRRGGIIGLRQQITVYENGQLDTQVNSGKKKQKSLSKLELEGLLKLLEDNNFFSMGPSYRKSGICDGFTYKVSCYARGYSKTVTATTGAGAPEGFWRILEGLENLL